MARVTNALKHTHKYMRRKDKRWACAGKDGCTHFMPSNMAPLPAGMMSDCWNCDKEFQLTPINMLEDMPMCDSCTEQIEMANRYLEEKMKGVEKPTGLTAFGAKIPPKPVPPVAVEEPDEIEIYEPEE